MKSIDLENRLIEFSVSIVELVQNLPDSKAMSHLSGQLIRSGSSAALNYGEAQAGESKKDFIHKIKIILKELRETHICLKIINRINSGSVSASIEMALKEANELVSIFVRSVQTAEKNIKKDELAS